MVFFVAFDLLCFYFDAFRLPVVLIQNTLVYKLQCFRYQNIFFCNDYFGILNNKCFVGKKASYNFFFLFFLTAAAFQYDNGSDQSKSLMNFLRHFNQNRHHVANPEGKQKARDFITKTFKDLGLITWSEPFKPDFPQVRFKLSFY